jgi:hypothetical protein
MLTVLAQGEPEFQAHAFPLILTLFGVDCLFNIVVGYLSLWTLPAPRPDFLYWPPAVADSTKLNGAAKNTVLVKISCLCNRVAGIGIHPPALAYFTRPPPQVEKTRLKVAHGNRGKGRFLRDVRLRQAVLIA